MARVITRAPHRTTSVNRTLQNSNLDVLEVNWNICWVTTEKRCRHFRVLGLDLWPKMQRGDKQIDEEHFYLFFSCSKSDDWQWHFSTFCILDLWSFSGSRDPEPAPSRASSYFIHVQLPQWIHLSVKFEMSSFIHSIYTRAVPQLKNGSHDSAYGP